MTLSAPRPRRVLLAALALALGLSVAPDALAQVVNPTPSQRAYRAYIPQDQLVSFLPDTPFSEFVALMNPVFQRVTGKMIVDPEGRSQPIGVSIAGMHFVDAFELVLDMRGLGYRETDGFVIIQEPVARDGSGALAIGTDGVSARAAGGAPPPATAASREIRIDAHIFELNVNRLREVGSNWASVLGAQTGGSGGTGGTGGTGTGTGQQGGLRLFLNTESFFDRLSGFIEGPARVDFADINRLFRYFESIGVGETVASPSVTVQSGEQGRIQSGTDIPVTLQDFAGNTITQYIATGIIIDVRPTLVADASDAPGGELVEFIHLDVAVEKSSGRPSAAGITIDKNQTKTQVLLLNGEQTVIGGLFSTEESVFRKGIPVLKDIPLIRYLFSYEQKTTVQKELLIVLQARVVEPLRTRAGQPYPTNLYERERQDVRQRLDRFKPGAGDDLRLINPENPERAYRAPADHQP
jgi:hypothetical protein